MTFISGSPHVASPEAKLASAQWRRANSWWILVAPVSCGLLSFVGFLVAAIRTGKRRYWISTAVYAGVWTIFMSMILASKEDSLTYDLATIPFVVCWIAPAIHAAIWNKDYLTTIAHKSSWHAQYATPATTPGTHQATSGFLGVDNAGYYGSDVPPPAPATANPFAGHPPQQAGPAPSAKQSISINTATASELVAALGIDRALADRVIGARHARGVFRDLDDLAAGAGLQPHQLIKFRNRITFSMPPQGNGPDAQTGRILDI